MALTMCSSIVSLLFVILMEFSHSANAHTFYVGGDDGWTLEPSENYTYWAERYRFQTNDEIVFKYKKGHDSVLVVTEKDYSKCNKDNPIKTLKSGDSKFKFKKSGPFYFISGHNQNCEKGQKLIIIVLSDHHNHIHNAPSPPPEKTPHQPPSSAPSPSTTAKTPLHAPPSHNSPSASPVGPAPITHHPPTHSPSPSSPVTHHSSPAPSPATKNPAHPPVNPPSHSSSPSNPIKPGSHPPSPSPAPKYAPISDSPSPYAPTPAPSSAASDFGNSFVGIVGFGIVMATMISAGFV